MTRLILLLLMGSSIFSCKKKPIESVEVAIENNAKPLLSNSKINAVSIGVFINEKKYSKHYGELDRGKGNTPTDSTIYEIASVSKSFTGTLVAQAVLEKRLSLEGDIRKYLNGNFSNLEYEGKPIKIKHLLTHTAGLPRFLPEQINELFNNIDENLPFRIEKIQKQYNKEKFLNDMQSVSIDVLPGERYVYSSSDTELLAHILENVYEKTFDELIQKHICEVAGMNNTKVHLLDDEIANLANGYGNINNKVPHFSNPLWGAGGGIKSTTGDLLNYMKFQMDANNQSPEESRKLLYANKNIKMGYLWPIINYSNYGEYYAIHGGAYGTQNYLLIFPKKQIGISIITNQSGVDTHDLLLDSLNNLLADIIEI